jgi:ABC-2 type transport system permease protein
MDFFRQTRLVFRRSLRLSLRNPAWVIIGLSQPILYLALFGPLLEPLAEVQGFPPGDAWQVFVPGILIQLGIFGSMFVGFGLVAEWRAGVVERMRVTPAPRAALLLGRVLRDVLVLVTQAIVLTLTAVIFFGLRASIGGVAIAIAVVGLLGAAFASGSYALALVTRSEDSLASTLNTFALPALLLSGILLPMTLAPTWLRRLSDANPLKHVVDGIREMFRGDFTVWPGLGGVGLTVALVILGIAVGARVFQRESA